MRNFSWITEFNATNENESLPSAVAWDNFHFTSRTRCPFQDYFGSGSTIEAIERLQEDSYLVQQEGKPHIYCFNYVVMKKQTLEHQNGCNHAQSFEELDKRYTRRCKQKV